MSLPGGIRARNMNMVQDVKTDSNPPGAFTAFEHTASFCHMNYLPFSTLGGTHQISAEKLKSSAELKRISGDPASPDAVPLDEASYSTLHSSKTH